MQQIRRTGVPLIATDAGPLIAGFLALQFFLGYEWFMSGLSKLLAGDFASGLAGTLTDMTKDQTGLYKSFVDGVVIPNGQLFGNLVMVGELGLGFVLVASALVWLTWWSQMSSRERVILLGAVAVFATVGAFMSFNFHMAMGATPPWFVSPDPNDQGVDLDSLMVVMQLVLVVASLRYLTSLRRPSK
jgi:uncharacterized membrane protein YphA (DoxX/SURF4 family)